MDYFLNHVKCNISHQTAVPDLKVWCTKIARENTCAYFKNSGPNWGKLWSFVDEHNLLHVIDLILCIFHFCLCRSFQLLTINLRYQKAY